MDRCILVIGGSDSCSGAGIQADIKTAASFGVHALSAVTCVTAQNSMSFNALQLVDPQVLRAQVEVVCEDFEVAAVKVGMVASPEAVVVIANAIDALREKLPQLPVVIDPVMAASTDRAAAKEVIGRSICRYLLPRATLITPNLPESQLLAGFTQQMLAGAATADRKPAAPPEHASDEVLASWAARTLVAAGAESVLVKGGHSSDEATCQDLLFSAAADLSMSIRSELVAGEEDLVPDVRIHVGPGERDAHLSRPIGYSAPRLAGEYHGTGCVLSTAIACRLLQGAELPRAVGDAHEFLQKRLANARNLGNGSKILTPKRF